MRVTTLFAIVFAIALSGCEKYDMDMRDQVHFKHQEFPRFMEPEGSVNIRPKRIDYSNIDGALLLNPHAEEKGVMEKGKKLYDIYCMPCHGTDGTTDNTPVADKFDPRPANLLDDAVMSLTEGEIYQRILEGSGVMPSYKYDLSDIEAWQVTAYVMKLQKK